MAKAEMSSTRCVVYSACLSGQSLWLNGDVEHTLCCLLRVSSGRSYVAKAEMSSTRCVVYSMSQWAELFG